MCGIFGYVGDKDSHRVVFDGLRRLEYRGYDSWGISVLKNDEIKTLKFLGGIQEYDELSKLSDSNIAIGHTRWATHGGVTIENAHPHYSTDKSFVLAQNGIVENYQQLKKELLDKGYTFNSQTDTEIIVRQIEENLKDTENLLEAVKKTFNQLEGRNTIIILSKDKELIAVRNGSPLVVGINDNEYFIGSDTLSFADKTNKVVFLSDYEMVYIKDKTAKYFDLKNDSQIQKDINEIDHKDVDISKEGFDHFMIKEIVEQKFTVKDSIQYTLEELNPLVEAIKSADTVYTVGAGTASFAAGQIAYFLRRYSLKRAIELKSYECESYKNLFTKSDLILAVSQSGETTDTIEVVEFAKEKGMKVASIVNMVGSTLTRLSDFKYLSRTGPEICVASTKAFTAQVSWGYLLSKSIIGEYDNAKEEVYKISEKIESYFSDSLFQEVKDFVKTIKDKEHFFVLGKGQNYYIALEGALKVKEITYKHFEGFAAGELKHGVIALIEKGTPVFTIISEDEHKADMLSAAAEVKARGAFVIGIAKESNTLFDKVFITNEGNDLDSILNIIPFQLISYFLALELGNPPDKPRNLAKSVTVK